jgi:2-polyprenyl-3-methyl-5-hydroxy-6-metoxy-1,4-benzoquinol methylase
MVAVERTSPPRSKVLEVCPVCKSHDFKSVFTLRDRVHGVSGEFSYSKCSTCESLFQNPMVIPEDLHLCYPSDYAPYNYHPQSPEIDFGSIGLGGGWKNGIRAAVIQRVRGRKTVGLIGAVGGILAEIPFLRERAFYGVVMDECLPRDESADRALDIGCGTGWMLRRLTQVGWDVEGVEWDEHTAETASARSGRPVRVGDFRDIDLTEGSYKLIVLNHVFEHLHDPVGTAEHIYKLLSKSGRAVLIFPNLESLDAAWFRENWFPWEAPRHLVFPSIKGMHTLVSRTKFATITVRSRADVFFWEESKRLVNDGKGKLNVFERILYSMQTVAAHLGLNKGSEVIVVLEK